MLLHNAVSDSVGIIVIRLFIAFSFCERQKKVWLEMRLRGRLSEGEMRNNRNIVPHQSIQLHDDILLPAKPYD